MKDELTKKFEITILEYKVKCEEYESRILELEAAQFDANQNENETIK